MAPKLTPPLSSSFLSGGSLRASPMPPPPPPSPPPFPPPFFLFLFFSHTHSHTVQPPFVCCTCVIWTPFPGQRGRPAVASSFVRPYLERTNRWSSWVRPLKQPTSMAFCRRCCFCDTSTSFKLDYESASQLLALISSTPFDVDLCPPWSPPSPSPPPKLPYASLFGTNVRWKRWPLEEEEGDDDDESRG